MTVSVLVPYSNIGGCQHREAARSYVLAHYAEHHPDWELVEGGSPDPWSKGAALADAASRAPGDVLVLADADSFTAPAVLEEAVALVGECGWVMPHWQVFRFNQRFTVQVLDGFPPRPGRTHRSPYPGVVGGGITVLTREAWGTVGGVDPRFHGWGGEDEAFGWALQTLIGPGVRLKGRLWHLWHPPEVKGPKRRGLPASEALAGRYRDARGNPDAMRALIEEVRSGSEPTDDVARDDYPART